MPSSLTAAEIRALAQLREARVTGTVPALPAAGGPRALEQQRLAQTDDYGNLQITERGETHLQVLERRGRLRAALRSGRPTPRRGRTGGRP